MKIHIKNGRLIDPNNKHDSVTDLYIAAGKIVSVGQAPAGFSANRSIDATGLIVCPGLIDLSVRLREPGNEYLATLESEMHAAVAGGVTSLVCPPDTEPVLDEPGLVEMLKYRAKNLNQAHVYPLGALTQGLAGKTLTEMAELQDAGCIGFSHANVPLIDTTLMMRAMQYAASFDFTVWLRPQDPYLANGGIAHDGEVATRLGLAGIPACAETIALSTIIYLMRETGARVHVCRLSNRDSVELIRLAKAEGLPISCDISINHAHLCDRDIGYFDANANLIPPLRDQRDRDGLRAGLDAGTIDALCSDHAPVDENAKQVPFAEAEAGATGVELLLPLTLKWANENKVPLAVALGKITSAPARILGLEAGDLSVGRSADICLFDPDAHWRIAPDALKSQGNNTPFMGYEMLGKVRMTLVDGHVVYES